MANKFVKSGYRFLLPLARQLLAERPDINTKELAHQLGVCLKAAYNYRAAVAAGAEDPPNPVKLARAYLEQHPRATATEIGAHLGLQRDAGKRYLLEALEDMKKHPAPPAQAPRVKLLPPLPAHLQPKKVTTKQLIADYYKSKEK